MFRSARRRGTDRSAPVPSPAQADGPNQAGGRCPRKGRPKGERPRAKTPTNRRESPPRRRAAPISRWGSLLGGLDDGGTGTRKMQAAWTRGRTAAGTPDSTEGGHGRVPINRDGRSRRCGATTDAAPHRLARGRSALRREASLPTQVGLDGRLGNATTQAAPGQEESYRGCPVAETPASRTPAGV